MSNTLQEQVHTLLDIKSEISDVNSDLKELKLTEKALVESILEKLNSDRIKKVTIRNQTFERVDYVKKKSIAKSRSIQIMMDTLNVTEMDIKRYIDAVEEEKEEMQSCKLKIASLGKKKNNLNNADTIEREDGELEILDPYVSEDTNDNLISGGLIVTSSQHNPYDEEEGEDIGELEEAFAELNS